MKPGYSLSVSNEHHKFQQKLLSVVIRVNLAAFTLVFLAIILFGISFASHILLPFWKFSALPIDTAAYFAFPSLALAASGLLSYHVAKRLKEALALSETAQSELEYENLALSRAQTELSAHRSHLERLVSERTSELMAVNERLQREVDQRAVAEEALRRERDFAAGLVETAPAIVLLLDPEGHITSFNPYVEQITGYRLDEVRGSDWMTTFIPEEIRGEVAAVFSKAITDGSVQGHISPIVTREGRQFVIEWYSRTLLDSEGKVVGLMAIGQNITERVEATEGLRHYSGRLEALRRQSLSIAAELDMNTLLQSIVDKSIDLVGGTSGVLFLLPNHQDRAEPLLTFGGKPSPAGSGLDRIEALARRIASTKEPLIVNDLDDDKVTAHVRTENETGHWGSFAGAPVQWGTEALGAIIVAAEKRDAFPTAKANLLSLFAGQAAVAVRNAQTLQAERAAQQQLHELAGYLQSAREKERALIAREVHDEFGQALTALKMDLYWLKKNLPAGAPALAQKMDDMSGIIDSTIRTVRRVATELRPGLLDEFGLIPAIEWQVQEFAERTGHDVEMQFDDHDIQLDQERATAIFRIFQETLTNVARHANANRIWVKLEDSPQELVLIVRDDGRGATQQEMAERTSLGLLGMRERARILDGDVKFESAPGHGMTVTARIPRPGAAQEKDA